MTAAGIILPEWIHALGWMLVHSLWQGSVLALLTMLILSITGHKTASFHYRVLLLCFIAFIITCTGTFVWYRLAHNYYSPPVVKLLPAPAASVTTLPAATNYAQVIAAFITAFAPLLVLCWFPFCCYRMVKNLVAGLYAHSLRNRDVFSMPVEWQQRFSKLAKQMQPDKKVRLLESGRVRTPVTLGFWKPVILMPMGMLCNLPAEQMEAVLRHELAHIRRNDYLVNLVQLFTEAIFFFNPSLLWLCKQLREKREFCCDDIALYNAENSRDYLLALLHFKSLELENTSVAMGFPAATSQLHKRVSRILNGNNSFKPVSISSLLFISSGILFLFAAMHIIPGQQPAPPTAARVKTQQSPATSQLPVTKQQYPQQMPAHGTSVKKPPANSVTKQQATQPPVTMDSATLRMLTGEFNTVYKGAHYVIGVANSRITYLTVNGEAIAQDNWHYHNNAFAAIVHEFTIHIANTEHSQPPLNNQLTQSNTNTSVNPE